ncbi:class II glutamine amidotransferase [Ilumatobacter nonamiensis]|uniref:class II glutamine amidotransferase n=1 Tax=Ilumatobacter nonamiensis TaxID=467093 RepID=UPI0005913471|nr:class II glutamine amidotransferase [Ilumatobacter nonamiensis]
MCRVLAYIGPELPIDSLLLEPENSLVNQTLDPELHPLLQLAGWGFACWSDHLLKPNQPFRYRRPMAAFYDDNAEGIIPSLQANTLLAHVRAAAYNAATVLADENCHPFSYTKTPWVMAQNGALPNWTTLQRELLPHCKDEYLQQMRGTTDTEFLYVLLLSLLEGDSDDDVQHGFEELLKVILEAMKALDLVALTKLKMVLVSPNRIIGANYGAGHHGEADVQGDWKELRESDPDSNDYALSMLLEPMYVLTGRNFQDYEKSYDIDVCPVEEATAAIFASEPLTEETDDWLHLEFGEMVALENTGSGITRSVRRLNV